MGEIENDGCLTNQVRDNLEPRRACGSGSGTSLDAPRMDRDTGRRIMSSSHSSAQGQGEPGTCLQGRKSLRGPWAMLRARRDATALPRRGSNLDSLKC